MNSPFTVELLPNIIARGFSLLRGPGETGAKGGERGHLMPSGDPVKVAVGWFFLSPRLRDCPKRNRSGTCISFEVDKCKFYKWL